MLIIAPTVANKTTKDMNSEIGKFARQAAIDICGRFEIPKELIQDYLNHYSDSKLGKRILYLRKLKEDLLGMIKSLETTAFNDKAKNKIDPTIPERKQRAIETIQRIDQLLDNREGAKLGVKGLALIAFYKQEARQISSFEANPKGKLAGLKEFIQPHQDITTSHKSFQQEYNKILLPINRVQDTYRDYINRASKFLEGEAKEIAEEEYRNIEIGNYGKEYGKQM